MDFRWRYRWCWRTWSGRHRNSQERTENILLCIDYTYSNLAEEAQQLLLCLAPFTSTFFRPTLDQYVERLKEQPILADLPFEQWDKVVEEAERWGLLTADADIAAFLHVQPTLPYFLRHRLGDEGSKERK